MKGLELVDGELLVPRIELERDQKGAHSVLEFCGMYFYDPYRDVYVLKPQATSSGLRALSKKVVVV